MSEIRRLPIYLLLDTSGSMMGDPIQSVQTGISQLVADLMASPRAMETAYLSVITFDSQAKQLAPLTELGQFVPPTLQAAGPTMMGEALKVLEGCLDNEVRRASPTQQGDYRPLIFLMTDGVPSDEKVWEEMADRIKGRKVGNIIALAAGSQANTAVLKRLTNNVVHMADLQPEKLQEYFNWVSRSIELTSRSVGVAAPDTPMAMPPIPPGITIIP
jgi:uncharacterized protein YegL